MTPVVLDRFVILPEMKAATEPRSVFNGDSTRLVLHENAQVTSPPHERGTMSRQDMIDTPWNDHNNALLMGDNTFDRVYLCYNADGQVKEIGFTRATGVRAVLIRLACT
jgi:hypothetical protein